MQVRVLPIIHKIDTTMKRKVKFRGKSKRTGKWLYGDLVRNVEGAFAVVPPFEMTTDNLCDRYEVQEDTIGQFTGLLDKNGKEIYEGEYIAKDDDKYRVYFDTRYGSFRAIHEEFEKCSYPPGMSSEMDCTILAMFFEVIN